MNEERIIKVVWSLSGVCVFDTFKVLECELCADGASGPDCS